MSSDLKHWRLNATAYDDRVEEIYYISDPARKIRRQKQTRVWQVETFLGRGGFGEVRLEKDEKNERVRAVKKIAITNGTLSTSECERELEALLEFSKPKYKEAAVFVDFFGWFINKHNIFLAMEYVALGDLEKNVVAHSGKIPESEARDIVEQILLGLEIMHTEAFAHRDLKPQNVLVINGPPNWWVKLADFGMSKRLTETTAYHTRGGTQLYMAPELLHFVDSGTSNSDYTNAIDIWSAGCIFYRLVAGVVPFPDGRSLMKYCDDKSLFPHDPLYDCGIKSEGARFLRQLLVPHPRERPLASQALKHKWILSGSGVGKTSPNIAPQLPPEERLEHLSLTIYENDYNTGSHAGLQSSQSLPSSPLQATQPLSPPAGGSLPSSKTVVPLVPARSPVPSKQPLASQAPPESEDSQLVISTEKTIKKALASETIVNVPSKYSSDTNSVDLTPVLEATQMNERPTSFEDLKCAMGQQQQVTIQHQTSMISPSAIEILPSPNKKPGWSTCTFEGHTKSIWSVAFSPDGKTVASASGDTTVRLWNVDTGAECNILNGHTSVVRAVAFSPLGKFVASASDDKTVRLWDTATGAIYRVLKGHTNIVLGVGFSPDGKLLASASDDRTVRLWDIDTGRERFRLSHHAMGVCSVAFSPDGTFIASGSNDKKTRIWDTSDGRLINTFNGHTSYVNSVAISPDSKIIASASSDHTIRLWELATGSSRTLSQHTNWVWSVAFSPDGKFIASGSGDKSIILWDAISGAVHRKLLGHTSVVYSVAFSPDGKTLVSGSADKTVRLWEISQLWRATQY